MRSLGRFRCQAAMMSARRELLHPVPVNPFYGTARPWFDRFRAGYRPQDWLSVRADLIGGPRR